MKERPILFSGPMVRAILEGRKTQTRRIVKQQPDDNGLSHMPNAPLDWRDEVHGEWIQWKGETPNGDTWRGRVQCWPGDRLWVRETHRFTQDKYHDRIQYRADGEELFVHDNAEWLRNKDRDRWRPSIFMPRWASRITLDVTKVSVQRLQDISEEDAKAEGCEEITPGFYRNYLSTDGATYYSAAMSFQSLWESINGTGSWDANPWVWVVTFKKIN